MKLCFCIFTLILVSHSAVCQLWKTVVPEDAIRVGDSFFKFIEAKGIDWTEADRQAREMGGALAIPSRGRMKIEEMASDSFMWIGAYAIGGDRFLFDGSKISLSIGYDEMSQISGPVFYSPLCKKVRHFGKYHTGHDVFPMDGFLCEWVLNVDNALEPPPDTVVLGKLTGDMKVSESNEDEQFEKFKLGEDLRTFISSDGKKLKGKFRGFEGDNVVIRSDEYKEFRVPLNRFSPRDIGYLSDFKGISPPDPNFELAVRAYVNESIDGRSPSVLGNTSTPSNSVFKFFPGIVVTLKNTGDKAIERLVVVSKIVTKKGTTQSSPFFDSAAVFRLDPSSEKKVSLNDSLRDRVRGLRFGLREKPESMTYSVVVFEGEREVTAVRENFSFDTEATE